MLREMLDNGGIAIALQPIVTLNSPIIVGWEALVRGEHPRLGPIPPVVLIEVALQNGLIDELTQRVTELAIDALTRAVEIVHVPLMVTVNVELEQLYVNNPLIEWMLGLEIHDDVTLLIEVTERGGDEWTPAHERTAELLSECGIQLGLDDVGAGSSRIGFFRDRDWELVKIDQQFLSCSTPRETRVVKLFAHMIHGLGLPSLAEGIETAEHLVFAQSMGIKYGQGYWLGRPTGVEQTLSDLRKHGLAIEASF